MKNLTFTLCFVCLVILTHAQDGEFHLDKYYQISSNGVIDLSSSDAKVYITGSSRADAHVKIDRKIEMKGIYTSKEDFRVEVTSTSGNLKIKEYQEGYHSGIIGYWKEEYKIVIEAPEGVSLTIRGDDGDYFVKNINGAISMNIDDADTELSNCKGDKFSFKIDDGDLRMDKGRGSLEIDVDDADVEIYNGQFTSITAEADDGDISIETSLANNGEYSFRSQDGLIALNITDGGGEFDIHHDDGHVVTMGNFKTTLETEDHTKVSLEKGTARVTVRADDARVKLSVRN